MRINRKKFGLALTWMTLVTLAFSLAPVQVAQAATPIYVRTDGNDDSCDGTVDAAYPGTEGHCAVKTIQKGVDLVDSPGTVHVAAGTYDEYLSVNRGVSIVGAGVSQVTIDVSGFAGSNSSGIYVSADNVSLQGFTLVGEPSSANPRYGIKFADVTGGSLTDILVKDVYRSGFDFLGTNNTTVTNVEAKDNGGHGISLCDCNDVTLSDITVSGNGWQGISVVTWGQHTPLGTSGIVFNGTNSFGDVFQLEQGRFPNGPPEPITYSTNPADSADVTVQASDFGYALHGADDEAAYQRIWFYKTLAEAQTAAASAPIGHFTGADMYIESLTDGTQLYVSPGCSIQAAIDAASAGDTINVAAGTYNEGITIIDKDLTIVGATTPSKPVVKPTADTGTANSIGASGRGWFQIHAGATVDFENLVFDGTGKLIHTAVHYHANSVGGTVESCDFVNIAHTPSGYQGRGINNYGQHVEVLNCTFTNIYRIGVFTYNPTADTLIKGCTYTGKGAGDWLDYAFEVGSGGNASIEENTITNCTGVALTDGSTSAGILATTYFGPGTQATITGNTLTDNTSGIGVGYDATDTSTVVAHYNNISGNTDYGIDSTGPAVDAENNWWGSAYGPQDDTGATECLAPFEGGWNCDTCDKNTEPAGHLGDKVSENVNYCPWMGAVPEPGTIIVEKQTDPDGAPDTFTFTGNAGGSIPDDGQIVVNGLQPGTYTSTETVPAGWNLTDIVCNDTNSSGDTDTRTATFQLEAGETVTCIFTNTQQPGTIIVEKQTDPDGAPDNFTFIGRAAGIISDGQRIVVGDLSPGTYTSTETVPAGWDLTSIVCDDSNSSGDVNTQTATFQLEAGETVTCTFHNYLPLDYGDAPDPTYPTLLASNGARHVVVPGHSLGPKIDAEPDGQPNALADGDDKDTMFPAPGNVPYPPGDEDGVALPPVLTPGATVTVTVDGGPSGGKLDAWIDFDGDGDWFDAGEQIFVSVPVGSGPNQLSFPVPAGATPGFTYARFRLSTAGGLLPTGFAHDGEVEDYLVEIEKLPGTIVVEKQTDPDGAPDDFTFIGDATGTISDGQQIVVSGLQPGTYTSTETVPAGWDLTSIVCDDNNSSGNLSNRSATFRLEAGETVTCTFTNVQRGSITIAKETNPDGGTGFDFSGDLGGFSLNDDDSHVFGNLLPDHYDVTEVVPSGWDLDSVVCTGGDSDSISNGVRVHLDPGEAIICTFTNVQQPNSISIVKETDPDGGAGFDFSSDFGNFSLDDDDSQVFTGLSVGDYDVTEVVPAGWDLDSMVCTGGGSTPITDGVRVHLDQDEAILCTFTNVQQPGSISIVKKTNPDGGTGFDFTGDLGTFSLDDGGSQVFTGLSAGDYDVTEAVTSGWDLNSVVCTGGDSDPISNGVTVHLDPDGAILCTFTNFQRGSITIVKETDPDGGTGFDFTGDLGSFSLNDGGSKVSGNLLPDDYDVTEAVTSGWDLDSVVCTGGNSDPISNGVRVHLDPGEAIICTFTNVQRGPAPPDYFIYLPLIQNDPVVAYTWSWGVSLPRTTASRR